MVRMTECSECGARYDLPSEDCQVCQCRIRATRKRVDRGFLMRTLRRMVMIYGFETIKNELEKVR